MENQTVGKGQVVVERALLEQMLESGERMLDGMNKLVEGLHTINVVDDEPEQELKPERAVEARVWDTSDDAMLNYDGDALIALRADHRADNHDPAGCRVCDVLARRLGSL